MKVTIVLCSYNQGRFIDDALRSLTTQEGLSADELEIILIDGGSTDGTLDVIARYRDKLDVAISEPDQGQSDALRKGFSLATGDILGWLCSDDLVESHTIREVIDYFHNSPDAQFVYGDAVFINEAGEVFEVKREIEWNWFVWLHDHNFIRQPSAFWRRTLYDRVGGIDPQLRADMDTELFFRFALTTVPRHVRRQWSRLRMYPDIKTIRMRSASDSVRNAILEKYGVSYRWRIQEKVSFWLAKVLRTYLKLRAQCYADSLLSQLYSLCSRRRWTELFGIWNFTADPEK
jgi:glycosyltransferase involved in cell wall biosynthesis